MNGRRGESIPRLERELEALRATITETESEQARQAALAEEAAAERRAAAENPAAFGEAARKAAEHGDERDRLGFVLERRRQDVIELERRLALARYENEHGAFGTALARQHDASKEFAAKARATDKAAATLVAARDEVDAARVRARELCPAGVEFELPADADEPEWPDVDRLIEALQAGPRRPLARAAAGIEEARRDGERRVETHAAQAARDAIFHEDFDRLKRATPEERLAAVAAAERLASELPSNEAARKAAQRRLERVRELAEAEQVEAAA